ncbi:MAG TPA: cytochrome P450 [Ktedonobacterales bacterium]
MTVAPLDYFSAEYHANPPAVYARAREQAPVHEGPALDGTGGRAWHVLRYADILSVLKDQSIVRHAPGLEVAADFSLADPVALFSALSRQSLLFNDPPNHTRLRALVGAAFTPRMIAGLGARVEAVTEELLDAAARRGSLDIVHEYALPLTLTVIAEMLGVPPADQPLLSQWAFTLVRAVDCKRTTDIYGQAIATSIEIFGYFAELLTRKRAEPSGDLLSQLVMAEDQEGRLNEQELIITATTLLMAGHETTVNLIGNGALLLLQHPDQLRLLRERPALITTAVEEFLRYHAPAQITSRYALRDLAIGSAVIPAGMMVNLALGSGNHDPAAFTDPERCDITRTGPRHLAFGMGMHYCVGAPLARLEASIAIPRLIARFPTLRIAQPEPVWRDTISFRGLDRLDTLW